MCRAGLPGVRPDAVGTVFPPSTKIDHVARAVKVLAPSKRLYNFPLPTLCCQLAPNQRPACGPNPGLRNRWAFASTWGHHWCNWCMMNHIDGTRGGFRKAGRIRSAPAVCHCLRASRGPFLPIRTARRVRSLLPVVPRGTAGSAAAQYSGSAGAGCPSRVAGG
jgi:hypothetical protein